MMVGLSCPAAMQGCTLKTPCHTYSFTECVARSYTRGRVHHSHRSAVAAHGTGLCAAPAVHHKMHFATAAVSAAASAGAQHQAPVLDIPADFDLPVAIALAAAAFEAYLEPVGANERFQEVTVNNTHVTYTDRKFLQQQFEGILQLTIHGAKDLKAVNITGGSDPYVLATLGDSSATTEVVWGNVNPKWGETYNLYVQQRSKALLKLRVVDKNKLMSDVDLGVVMTGLDTLLAKPGRQVELPLKGTNAQGRLLVSALFLPFSEELMDAAVAENTMKAPDTPEEVAQISTQLDVAMAVQDQLTSTVQQLATDLQQKVGLGPSGDPAASTDAVSSAVGVALASKQEETGGAEVAELGAVVEEAQRKAVQTLSTALDTLQQSLSSTGLGEQAKAVAQGRDNVEGKVKEAADAVASFVMAEGLSSLPVNDLGGIIARIAATRLARGQKQPQDTESQQQQQQQLEAAVSAAASAAASMAEGDASSLPKIVQEAMPQAWKALASAAGKMVEMFRPVAFIENKETDTQVWVYLCEELREVVVAFRGTEQVKWKDLVSDLNLVPTTLDVERTGAMDLGIGNLPLPFANFKKNKDLMVHSGFLGAYDSVKNKVFRIVDQLTATRSAEDPWCVFVTGHSLGGALATLAAYDLAGRKGPAASGIVPYMYTYGAPRVGNKAFADDFNKRLKGNSWRITNSSDIVPSVPRLMGYAHVSRGVRLDSKGGLRFDQGGRDVLGEGREVAEVISDLASQAVDVAKGKKGLDEVVDAIKEHEMQILNSLVDGSALGQHMEDFYLATLKEAVLVANPALAGQVQQALEDVAASAAADVAAAAAEAAAAASESTPGEA